MCYFFNALEITIKNHNFQSLMNVIGRRGGERIEI